MVVLVQVLPIKQVVVVVLPKLVTQMEILTVEMVYPHQ